MNILNLEDEKFKTVKVHGYSFKVRYISPLDRANIIRHRMKLQAGNPIESLTADDYLYFENIAICDTCIETFPDGFTEHESSLKWDDMHLINGVAGEIRKHTEEVEAKLKKNRPANGVV